MVSKLMMIPIITIVFLETKADIATASMIEYS